MARTSNVKKGSWTEEEDKLLKHCIEKYGEGKWRHVPARAGLNRCRKSCRLRWLNYLRPNIKRGDFAVDEVDLIIRLHRLLGNRWSLIAGRIPGRTANDIKNYWNSHLSKKLVGAHDPQRSLPSIINHELDTCTSTSTSEWQMGSAVGDELTTRNLKEEERSSNSDAETGQDNLQEKELEASFSKNMLLDMDGGETGNVFSGVGFGHTTMGDGEGLLSGFDELFSDTDLWDVLDQISQ